MTFEFERDLSADERVNAWILAKFRAGVARSDAGRHLIVCPVAQVRAAEGSDGFYGCDTGCEYARLTATIYCNHGPAGMSEEFEYGDFGDLADILEEIGA